MSEQKLLDVIQNDRDLSAINIAILRRVIWRLFAEDGNVLKSVWENFPTGSR